ncbi:LOW QUALITY PROTEIN: heat shock protein beta-9 [Orycteropus afer afer]|uniref:Heat shock protein beta-9 n=1 Tax=Orycteropus afer afer TaxID=1230840 RepID=A0A8B7A2H0_ORYAF|nr:LOW QUALITY PROTEIN: heat shock protein beta-9 [Orycteropus afer afer]
MQRVGSGLSNEKQVAVFTRPSVALAEHNQVARLPVRLLRDDPAAAQDDHAEGGFQWKVDAHGFTPEELEVRVDGGCLIVTGQQHLQSHRPGEGSFCMARKVHRRMQLPPDLDPAAMTCCLTPSGQLCVRSQCRALLPPETQTGPSPRLRGRSCKSSNLA